MEKLLCSCCGAAIVPTVAQAFLTCEYCDTSVPNPYYDATAAAEAAKPSLEDSCLCTLLEIGKAQNLASLDPDCFGTPITGIDAARAGLSISDADNVYLLYQHTFLFVAFSDGLALTDSGLYYKCEGGSGRLSWESFITGAIACVDRTDDQEGTLSIGSTIELPVKSEKDSRLARFLVDFHNQVYRQHTGETAPASWAVTDPAASVQEEASGSSLLGSVLPAVGALLGSSALRKQTISNRAPAMHPTSHPTLQQDRRNHVEPPRPLQTHPHHRPAASKINSSRFGVSGQPDRPGHAGGRPGPSGMGGPGRPGRPGHSGMGGPGRSGRPGGKGRR